MPRDPFIREKFTKERTAARKLATEYFERFPKDRYPTEVEKWRELQSQKHRVHHEAAARPDRARRLIRNFAPLPYLTAMRKLTFEPLSRRAEPKFPLVLTGSTKSSMTAIA